MKLTAEQREKCIELMCELEMYKAYPHLRTYFEFLSRALELLDTQELSPEDKAKVFVEGITYEDLKTPVRDLLVRLQRAPNPFYERDAVRIFVEALDSLKILEE